MVEINRPFFTSSKTRNKRLTSICLDAQGDPSTKLRRYVRAYVRRFKKISYAKEFLVSEKTNKIETRS